jgi:uncharacterized protein (DUF4415 family)
MKKSTISKKSGTDFERFAAIRDEDIDFSEIPEFTDEMFARSVVRPPLSVTHPREEFTVKLDRDLAKWYRDMGQDASTVINFVLRRYMQEELRKPPRPKAPPGI